MQRADPVATNTTGHVIGTLQVDPLVHTPINQIQVVTKCIYIVASIRRQ